MEGRLRLRLVLGQAPLRQTVFCNPFVLEFDKDQRGSIFFTVIWHPDWGPLVTHRQVTVINLVITVTKLAQGTARPRLSHRGSILTLRPSETRANLSTFPDPRDIARRTCQRCGAGFVKPKFACEADVLGAMSIASFPPLNIKPRENLALSLCMAPLPYAAPAADG